MNSILCMTVSGILLAVTLTVQAATVNSRIITESTGSQLTQQALFLYNSQDEDDKRTAFIMANKALDYLSTDYVAARLLGNMYYHGIGVKVDKEEALMKYIYAADNDAVSAFMAGSMYLNGDGVEKDLEYGVELVKQAADMGEPEAQLELAQQNYKQSKLEPVPAMKLQLEKSALHYATSCSKQKQTECMEILADIFKGGLAGIPVSESSADELYKLAEQVKSGGVM
ncbi:hypothetical protein AMD27_16390 (plasmid) [Acinetobacter sp. TGL-Y2]|uniref:tetratricopeptide repeat protein n=1 Tax=Acinetobacter sp. TGL-Y2 TaxID=1407071 RepID=UPI0007A66349|nr:tetratricopeptide repeat protein [Acinetobacter sp. TGL-Y2]AMW80495.1 hypothetical protein AMD27_16390 [Acinetobacter sp. TGL-Y2]